MSSTPINSTPRAVACLAFIAALFVAPAFLPGRVLLPVDLVRDYGAWKTSPLERVATSNRLLADPLIEFAAWDHVSRSLIAEGRFPWRNPFAAGGAHLFANPESALLSPFVWPRLTFGVHGWAITGFLRLFVAGIAMYWLMRVLGGTILAALLGGAIYMMSGYVVVWLLYSHATVFALLPALAAAVLRSLDHATPRALAVVVVLSALASAGGHPETLAHLVVGFGVFLAVHGLLTKPWRRGAVVRTALAALAGLLLLGVQLVPFFGALRESWLYGARDDHRSGFRIHAVAAQLLPGYLGTPLKSEIELTGFFPHGENFNERTGGFIGLSAFLILLAGARSLPVLHRRMVLVGGVLLLVSWRTPVLWWLVHKIPLFSHAANERFSSAFVMLAVPAIALIVFQARRFPRLGMFLLVLGAVAAAGGLFLSSEWSLSLVQRAANWGIGELMERAYLTKPAAFYQERLATYIEGIQGTAFRRAFLPGLCWLVAGVGLRRSQPLVVAAALVCELLAFGIGYNPVVRVEGEHALRPPRVVEQLQTIDAWEAAPVAVLGDAIPANLLTFYNVRDLRSYDVMQPMAYVQRLAGAGYDPVAREFPDRGDAQFVQQLRALGARFIIGRSTPEGTVQVGGLPSPGVGLYEIVGAASSPSPSNAPPTGVLAGLIVSFVGLLLAGAVVSTARGIRRET